MADTSREQFDAIELKRVEELRQPVQRLHTLLQAPEIAPRSVIAEEISLIIKAGYDVCGVEVDIHRRKNRSMREHELMPDDLFYGHDNREWHRQDFPTLFPKQGV